MKLYTTPGAPSPARVHFFAAEKGLELKAVPVNLMKGEHKTPEFRAISPNGRVPALQLEDGSVLCETMAICRYLEAEHPQPNLFGVSALDQARIEMWNRMMEMEVLLPMGMTFRHTHPAMGVLEDQVTEFGEKQRAVSTRRLKRLNRELADRPWIAGEQFSVADITAYCAIRYFRVAGFVIEPDWPELQRWYDAVSARPAAAACTLR